MVLQAPVEGHGAFSSETQQLFTSKVCLSDMTQKVTHGSGWNFQDRSETANEGV